MTMNIEHIQGFLELTPRQRKKLLNRILNDAKTTPREKALQHIEGYDPQFVWQALYVLKAMHEVQKSGYAYTLNDF